MCARTIIITILVVASIQMIVALPEPLPTAVSQRAKSNYQTACDTKKNCTLQGSICLNGKCVCGPNRIYQNGRCRYMSNCLDAPYDTVCEDDNRECKTTLSWLRVGSCVCKQGFIEDPITKACRPMCSFKTMKERPCAEIDGGNSICNVYRCQCRPNHRRNATGSCEPFQCSTNSSCWSDGDVYRTCRNGTCVCDYDIDPLTQRCTIKFGSIFNYRYYNNWHAEKLLLCTIIITPLVFYYCLMSNLRKAKSTIVTYKAPKPGDANFQPAITIHAMVTEMKRNYGSDCKEEKEMSKTSSTGSLDGKKTKKSENFKYERFS